MPYPYVPPWHHKFMTVQIEDVSTAGQKFFTPGFSGKIRKIHSSINGVIATADVDLTAKIGGVAVTGGVITVTASGSAAGDSDSATPTANNSFTDSQSIEIETDGASTNTVEGVITFELVPS